MTIHIVMLKVAGGQPVTRAFMMLCTIVEHSYYHQSLLMASLILFVQGRDATCCTMLSWLDPRESSSNALAS